MGDNETFSQLLKEEKVNKMKFKFQFENLMLHEGKGLKMAKKCHISFEILLIRFEWD